VAPPHRFGLIVLKREAESVLPPQIPGLSLVCHHESRVASLGFKKGAEHKGKPSLKGKAKKKVLLKLHSSIYTLKFSSTWGAKPNSIFISITTEGTARADDSIQGFRLLFQTLITHILKEIYEK